MQLYDIKEDKGYPEPEIVPDELGDYYLAEEVDKQIAALNAELKKYKAFWEQSRLADRQTFEIYLNKESERERQIATLTEELRLSGLRGDSLDRVIEEGAQKELALEAENEKMEEVLEKCLDWLSEYTDAELVKEVKDALGQNKSMDCGRRPDDCQACGGCTEQTEGDDK